MDVTRMIGWRIRRIRNARDKPLRVIAGLAGMGRSTLHRIEHGQRDVTRSEIVALSSALEIAPSKLTILPILAHTNEHTNAAKRALRPAPVKLDEGSSDQAVAQVCQYELDPAPKCGG